jgi:hypothetical protein
VLRRFNLGKFLEDITIESKLLELGEAQVAKAVVPTHELGLIIGSSKLDVFCLEVDIRFTRLQF